MYRARKTSFYSVRSVVSRLVEGQAFIAETFSSVTIYFRYFYLWDAAVRPVLFGHTIKRIKQPIKVNFKVLWQRTQFSYDQKLSCYQIMMNESKYWPFLYQNSSVLAPNFKSVTVFGWMRLVCSKNIPF